MIVTFQLKLYWDKFKTKIFLLSNFSNFMLILSLGGKHFEAQTGPWGNGSRSKSVGSGVRNPQANL